MNTGNYMYFAPLVAATVCLALLFVLVRSQSLPKDLPNERSLMATSWAQPARWNW